MSEVATTGAGHGQHQSEGQPPIARAPQAVGILLRQWIGPKGCLNHRKKLLVLDAGFLQCRIDTSLEPAAPTVRTLGVKRLVRDVFHVNGLVERDAAGHIRRIVLNQAHCYARRLRSALQALVGAEHVAISLDET